MFDLAWSEIMLIGAVALVVIGPKELPGAIRSISQFIRKAREMAWEMRGHVDEMVREANLDEVRNQINEIRNFDIKGEVTKTVDPDGSLRRAVSEAGESIQEATRAMDDPDRHPGAAGSAAAGTEDAVAEGEAAKDGAAEDEAVDRLPEPPADAGADDGEREPAGSLPPAAEAAGTEGAGETGGTAAKDGTTGGGTAERQPPGPAATAAADGGAREPAATGNPPPVAATAGTEGADEEAGAVKDRVVGSRTAGRQQPEPAAATDTSGAARGSAATGAPSPPPEAPHTPGSPAAGAPPPAAAPVAAVTTPRPPAPAYEPPAFVPPGTSRN